MLYYKIPLAGSGLSYPAGCILICAYTYDGYEYCKFERVTEVGANWVAITESEFNVRCPDFPEPAPAPAQEVIATDATYSEDGFVELILPRSVGTGTLVKFLAPCDCDATSGIVVDDCTYLVVDATGKLAMEIGNLWSAGAMVAVLIDADTQQAYIQNASLASRVEAAQATADAALPKSGGTMKGMLTTKGIRLTNGVDYGESLPAAGTPGRLFFKVVN